MRSPNNLYLTTLVVRDRAGRVLMRERPKKGLWAGMWETPSAESASAHPDAAELAGRIGAKSPERVGDFEHVTTHRRVLFEVWAAAGESAEGRWICPDELSGIAVSNAQRRVFEIASACADGLFSERP